MIIGNKIYQFEVVSSTNDIAKGFAEKGDPEGTCVIAKQQTHGKGRGSREWISEMGGLYLSIILRPKLLALQVLRLTLLTGVVVYQTLQKTDHLRRLSLKWPNDVLIGNKKVCGILIETTFIKDKINYAIVGIGINVNNEVKNIEGMVFPATSLKEELGKEINIEGLTKNLFQSFEDYYFGKSWNEIVDEWKLYSSTLNRKIKIKLPNEEFLAFAIGIDNNGFLLVRRNGHILRIKNADVIY